MSIALCSLCNNTYCQKMLKYAYIYGKVCIKHSEFKEYYNNAQDNIGFNLK